MRGGETERKWKLNGEIRIAERWTHAGERHERPVEYIRKIGKSVID